MRNVLITFMALTAAGLAQAAAQKLAPELRNLKTESRVDVIVQFRHTPTQAQHRKLLKRGGQLKDNLDIVRAAHYSISAKELEALSNDPDIEFISGDQDVKVTANSLYTGNPDYGWRTVGADLATNVFGLDGSGIGTALTRV